MQKVITAIIYFTFFTFSGNICAQVKIGDNPNTINSNSLLELESASKGFLAPRVSLNSLTSASPLTAPVPAGMLVYSSGGTLADGYYFWNGTSWLKLLTSVNQRSNFVLVKSEADFPAPVSGVITLAAGTVYEINGTILLTNKINLNGAWLTGMDAVYDKLIYTLSAGELFTGNNGGNIRTLTLTAANAGSKLFNIDAAGANKNLIVQNCYMIACDNIGLIKGFGGTVYFQTTGYFYNNNGITYQNCVNLIVSNSLWDTSNKNTYETFTGTFSVIQKVLGAMVITAANSAKGMDISGITSVTNGELKNAFFIGDGTYVVGSFSKQWEVIAHGLSTETDDVASGNLYLTSSGTTTFSAVNTPTKVVSSTTTASLFRVTSSTDNRLTYAGTKTRRFAVIASLSLTSTAANKYFSFYIAKNGVIQPESRQAMKLSTGVDKGSLTLSCTIELAANDYIEVWAENTSDGSSCTVESLNLAIK